MPLLLRAQAPTSSETSFARPASSRQKLGLACCTATWLLTRPFHRNTHLYTCFVVTLCDSHRPVWRCLADCKLVFQPLAPQFFVARACTKCLLEPQLSCLRAHRVAVSLLVLLPQAALLLVCDCYILWHHQPGILCLSYRYMLPSPCGSISSRLLCQGWQTTAACQFLPVFA
jgi:hypothetical protein